MSKSALKILDPTFTPLHPRVASFDDPSGFDWYKASFPFLLLGISSEKK
jgi:hypothetical protein